MPRLPPGRCGSAETLRAGMAGAKDQDRTASNLLAELAGAAPLAATAATAFAAATVAATATVAAATAVATAAAATTAAAVAATTAAAATTTAAVAATTATAAAAAAAAAGLPARLVDDQAAAFERVAVQSANGGLRRLVGGHRDEAEAARAAGFAIGDDLGIDDFTVIAEKLRQLRVGRAPRQVAHVDLGSHRNSFLGPLDSLHFEGHLKRANREMQFRGSGVPTRFSTLPQTYPNAQWRPPGSLPGVATGTDRCAS